MDTMLDFMCLNCTLFAITFFILFSRVVGLIAVTFLYCLQGLHSWFWVSESRDGQALFCIVF